MQVDTFYLYQWANKRQTRVYLELRVPYQLATCVLAREYCVLWYCLALE